MQFVVAWSGVVFGLVVAANPEELFVARSLTAEGSFTAGVEGPACDRQGDIFVGAAGYRFFDEHMPRHRQHRFEHDFVAYALFAQALHHPGTGARTGHPDAAVALP